MNDNVQLDSPFRGDKIGPGRYFFARIDNVQPPAQDSWWIVMVVTSDLFPSSLHKEKRNMRNVDLSAIYPCWLMGKNRFLWIPKNRLYYPHESQQEKFHRPVSRLMFKQYYDLATGEAASTGIERFSLEILNCCEVVNAKSHVFNSPAMRSPSPLRRSENPLFFSEAGSQTFNDLFGSDDDSRPSKRLRREQSPAASPVPDIASTSSDTLAGHQIKTEEEEETFAAINGLAQSELVTIYVGANSHEHRIPRADLAKSPILTSWVKTDSDAPYIMHPDLRTVNNQHFGSLIRFMYTGEYLPRIVEIPSGMSELGTVLQRKGLDKLKISEEYSAQLVRAGHLYELAEQFQVQGLTDYIFNRVSEAEFITYTNEALLTFANNIFSRPAATISESSETNKLEVWILEKIAWEFQVIMKNHAAQFFKIPSKTGKSNFFPRLLRRKAEQVEEIGGEPDYLE